MREFLRQRLQQFRLARSFFVLFVPRRGNLWVTWPGSSTGLADVHSSQLLGEYSQASVMERHSVVVTPQGDARTIFSWGIPGRISTLVACSDWNE